jgi:NhaC family Na+:H+ antiporter
VIDLKERKMNIFLAILPIITVVVLGLMSVMVWKVGMFIPLIGSIVVSVLLGFWIGKPWSTLEKGLVDGVSRSLVAVFILMIVGAIIGTWILGGIIPTLIYFGLKLIHPNIFIPMVALVTAIISTSTGTSFTSIATVGLALMAAGITMGFPSPLIAGAIISGAYFGDKISPLSDTTNLAPAMAGCTLFEHIGSMLWGALPAFILSVILYYIVGLQHVSSEVVNSEAIQSMMLGLSQIFNLSPWLLIFPIVTIILAIKKVPAVPALFIVAIVGGFASIVFQGAGLNVILNSMTFGYKSTSGITQIDSLLSRGGITSMGSIIMLLMIATALGGILEEIGALDVILSTIMKKVKTRGQLVLATMISGMAIGFATGAQLLAIVIPARMFAPAYKDFGLHAKNLSRAAEAVGTVGINLVPWSVPAVFAMNILGVQPIEFIPYIFFAYIVIAINIIFGFTGWFMAPLEEDNSKTTKFLA